VGVVWNGGVEEEIRVERKIEDPVIYIFVEVKVIKG
jgi:hypothetical protein